MTPPPPTTKPWRRAKKTQHAIIAGKPTWNNVVNQEKMTVTLWSMVAMTAKDAHVPNQTCQPLQKSVSSVTE